jgi:hypothetical protein
MLTRILCVYAIFLAGCTSHPPVEKAATEPDASTTIDAGIGAADQSVPEARVPAPDASAKPLTIPARQTDQLGAANISYGDPEILQEHAKLAFQERDTVWLADLDPVTGLLVSATGRDIKIDTDAPSMTVTNNGPEFGVSRAGWAVYYAKGQNPIQVWRATLEGQNVKREQITTGDSHVSQLISKNPSFDETLIMCIRGSWEDGTGVWFDAATPNDKHTIYKIEGKQLNSPRWVDGQKKIVYAQLDQAGTRQLFVLDTASGKHAQITNDSGDKAYPYGWLAPEHGGELTIAALVDDKSLAVYRKLGGTHWTRVSDMPVPAGAEGGSMGSPEPFVAKGRSYVSLTITMPQTGPRKNQQVWIYDISKEGTHTMRCDDGRAQRYRIDPETYAGSEQVFVYYYVVEPGKPFSMHRCATGIRTR